MKIPRLLFIITDSGLGGAEKVLLDVLKLINRQTTNVIGVLVLKEKREMARLVEQLNIPIIAFGMKKWPTPSLVFKLYSKIRSLKPDIVHTFTTHSLILGRLLRLLPSTYKLISAPHVNCRNLPKFLQMFVRWTRFLDDRTLCEGSPTRTFLIDKMGYDPNKTIHVANGIHLKNYSFDDQGRKRVRNEWRIPQQTLLIGSVGRLHHQKGFDILIQALEQVKTKVPLQAVIVGEGSLQSDLEKQIKKSSVPLRLVGLRKDIPSLLSSFDIYIQSSRYEGMPISLLEAMSVGRPIIATQVDGTVDMASNGDTMRLIPPENPMALAEAIEAFAKDKILRDRYAERAKMKAQEFDVHRMTENYESVYRSLWSSEGRSGIFLKSQH